MSEKILYVKYSNDRSKEFNISTQIIKTNNEKVVRKIASNKESVEHIQGLSVNYKRLLECYKNSRFIPNKIVAQSDKFIDFEFLDTVDYESFLDSFLKNDTLDEFFLSIETIFNEFDKCDTTTFVISKEFEEVFGKIDNPSIFSNTLSFTFSNIDMIFQNIFFDSEKFSIIDYEWCFDFLIPIDFIKWRMLYIYIFSSENRLFLKDKSVFEKFGINEQKQKIFKEMQKNFDKYVFKESKNLISYLETLGKTKYNIYNDLFSKLNHVDVFYDTGFGFSESEKSVHQTFPITISSRKDLKSLRIDPSDKFCIVKVKAIKYNNQLLTFDTNAFYNNEDYYFFNTIDSNILVKLPENITEAGSFNFDMDVYNLNSEILSSIKELDFRIKEKDDKLIQQSEMIKTQNTFLATQNQFISGQNVVIRSYTSQITEKNTQINDLTSQITEKNTQINDLTSQITEKNTQINDLTSQITEKNTQLTELTTQINEFSIQLDEEKSKFEKLSNDLYKVKEELIAIYNSRSWKLTKPLRAIVCFIKKLIVH